MYVCIFKKKYVRQLGGWAPCPPPPIYAILHGAVSCKGLFASALDLNKKRGKVKKKFKKRKKRDLNKKRKKTFMTSTVDSTQRVTAIRHAADRLSSTHQYCPVTWTTDSRHHCMLLADTLSTRCITAYIIDRHLANADHFVAYIS